VVNYHGRTIHAATIPAGSIVELTLNDKTHPPRPQSMSPIRKSIQHQREGHGTIKSPWTIPAAPSSMLIQRTRRLSSTASRRAYRSGDRNESPRHRLAANGFRRIADRVIHYCQDNSVSYKSSIPDSAFTDATDLTT